MKDIFDIAHAVKTAQCYYADMPEQSDSGNLSSNEEKLDIKVIVGAVRITECRSHIGKTFHDCLITDNYYKHLVKLYEWREGILEDNSLEWDVYCLNGNSPKELSIAIKDVSNYYGSLTIKRDNNNYYWAVGCQINKTNWVIIPKFLFDVVSEVEIKRRWY